MSPAGDLTGVALHVAQVCDRLRVPFAFGSAIAQNFWGTIRATQDVDILVAVPRVRFEELASLLREAGFKMQDESHREQLVEVAAMVAQECDRHLFVVYQDLVKVEFFLPFLPLQHSILRRRVLLPLAGHEIPITTAEDLIVLKMVFHREKDLRDVRGILWVQKGKLDLAYMRQWASRMLEDEVLAELEGWIDKYAKA